MVIEWRACKQEVEENDFVQDRGIVNAFLLCGFLKYLGS